MYPSENMKDWDLCTCWSIRLRFACLTESSDGIYFNIKYQIGDPHLTTSAIEMKGRGVSGASVIVIFSI